MKTHNSFLVYGINPRTNLRNLERVVGTRLDSKVKIVKTPNSELQSHAIIFKDKQSITDIQSILPYIIENMLLFLKWKMI